MCVYSWLFGKNLLRLWHIQTHGTKDAALSILAWSYERFRTKSWIDFFSSIICNDNWFIISNCNLLNDRAIRMRLENGRSNMAAFMGKIDLWILTVLFKCIYLWSLNSYLFRIFDGHMPILIISDPDMVQEIFVKQFSNFSARRVKINHLVLNIQWNNLL